MPIYAIALVWIIYGAKFPLYKLSHLIICAAISALAAWVANKIWKPKTVIIEEPEPEPEPEPVKEESTGNPDLDAFILEGKRAASELTRLNDNIEDEEISRRIYELTELSDKIFAHVEANPKKLPRARKFVNYYLPTTIKLLNAYDRMGSQGIEGDNISGTMHRIEDILDNIVVAFRKQLDSLFREDAMDISSDITVLQDMMQREGFLNEDGDFKIDK